MTSTHYVDRLKHALDAFPHEALQSFINVLQDALRQGRRVYVMGNGGSSANASHWVCDLNKACSYGRPSRFKVICLNDNVPTMLAYANDLAYEDIFAEQLKNFLEPSDVVVAISGSGNSPNVVKAVDYANSVGANTVALVGFDGGKLARIARLPVHIAVNDMQFVEDIHSITLHMVMKHFTRETQHDSAAAGAAGTR